MAGAKRTLYWDTCIWLAWVRDEQRTDPNDMPGVQEQAKEFHEGKISIATSVLALGEMLDLQNQLSAPAHRKFQAFFRRPDIIRISADIRVAEITQQIRDYYWLQSQTDGCQLLNSATPFIWLLPSITKWTNLSRSTVETVKSRPERSGAFCL